MGKGLIVYQSKYGATKKYAMWLAETAGFDVIETAKAENRMLEQYDSLVLCGGIYASGIAGISFLRKNKKALEGKNSGNLSRQRYLDTRIGLMGILASMAGQAESGKEILRWARDYGYPDTDNPDPWFYLGLWHFNRQEMEEILNGGEITKRVKQELTYRDIDDSVENVWSVLYATGYLTGKHVEGADADIFRLWIPNGEICKLFSDLVQDWFREVMRSDSARINRFCAAFPAGDVATIQDMLRDYLWDSISVRDTAARTNMKENFYHGMLLGLLRSQGSWLVKSNAETGEGYSDISIRTPERTGIVIELKYADDGNLESACAKALKQIEEKKYAEGLKRRGIKKIMKYGIAFCEKECMVVMA